MDNPSDLPIRQRLFQRTGKILGIKHVQWDADLARYVEAGLPVRRTITALIKSGLDEDEIYSLIVSRRKLSHRNCGRDPLTREESDRAVCVGRILALADDVFGDRTKALSWLRKPKQVLENRPPLELLSTNAGSRAVEELLYQIAFGMPV